MSVVEHKALKHLPATVELDAHMDTQELNLLSFVQSLANTLNKERNSQTFGDRLRNAVEAAEIGSAVRRLMESVLGRPVVNDSNFLDEEEPEEEPPEESDE